MSDVNILAVIIKRNDKIKIMKNKNLIEKINTLLMLYIILNISQFLSYALFFSSVLKETMNYVALSIGTVNSILVFVILSYSFYLILTKLKLFTFINVFSYLLNLISFVFFQLCIYLNLSTTSLFIILMVLFTLVSSVLTVLVITKINNKCACFLSKNIISQLEKNNKKQALIDTYFVKICSFELLKVILFQANTVISFIMFNLFDQNDYNNAFNLLLALFFIILVFIPLPFYQKKVLQSYGVSADFIALNYFISYILLLMSYISNIPGNSATITSLITTEFIYILYIFYFCRNLMDENIMFKILYLQKRGS